MKKRPPLTRDISTKDFLDFYWERTELARFCKEIDLSTSGSKGELEKRILHFLNTGEKLKPKKVKRSGPWDSESGLSLSSKVINFKNDQATRDFFVAHIGNHFRVNQYLRDFCKQQNDGSMTYQDLIEGYKTSLTSKKTTIDKQFQYNQFQRDFFSHESGKSQEDCARAWKLIRSLPGKATYEHYKSIKSKDPS